MIIRLHAHFSPAFYFSFFLLRPPPLSTLFPYTTLFRSQRPSPAAHLSPRCEVRRLRSPVCVRCSARVHDPSPSLRPPADRKSTRLNSSHLGISYAVFCLKKKNKQQRERPDSPEEQRGRP